MILQTAPYPIQGKLRPIINGTFQFACHPKVPCFTECCRDLNLLLTPYDLVRLKNHLHISSSELIDRYTELRFDGKYGIPLLFLKMRKDKQKTCPFVSREGCKIYPDRPSACRIYPLARASRKDPVHGVTENYFVLQEDHCRGFDEPKTWTIEEWILDQGLTPYHEMNNAWMEVLTHPAIKRGLSEKHVQMFYLASYDIDRFRRLVLNTKFLKLFDLDEKTLKKAMKDDSILLGLACRWLRFCLCGDWSSLRLKKTLSSSDSIR